MKLKYALPFAQMALGLALLRWANVWDSAKKGMQGPAPSFVLLVYINAPVATLRAFLLRHLPYIWDSATLIAAIGLFWYWIALNVDSWRDRGVVLMFSWTPLRVVGDLVLISIGVILGFHRFDNELWIVVEDGVRSAFVHLSLSSTWTGWPWFLAIVLLHLGWCVLLVFLFGRDLIDRANCKSTLHIFVLLGRIVTMAMAGTIRGFGAPSTVGVLIFAANLPGSILGVWAGIWTGRDDYPFYLSSCAANWLFYAILMNFASLGYAKAKSAATK